MAGRAQESADGRCYVYIEISDGRKARIVVVFPCLLGRPTRARRGMEIVCAAAIAYSGGGSRTGGSQDRQAEENRAVSRPVNSRDVHELWSRMLVSSSHPFVFICVTTSAEMKRAVGDA